MHITTLEVFPGLKDLISPERFRRVDGAVQTLFTRTIQKMEDGLPFIITGDIPAMWLRDSTWQLKPLLVSKNPEVIELLVDVSRTQVKLFLEDPFANAFNSSPNGNCWHKDFPDQSPWVFERKFELDSWASILYFARKLYANHGRSEHLDKDFRKAVKVMLSLAKSEQHHDPESYIFHRNNKIPHDSLSHAGRGAPTAFTGMIFSGFRPSDDACTYGYLIPSNLFFMNELRHLPIRSEFPEVESIAEDISQGVARFGVIDGIYAYEVDGMGNALFMDDANVPSLLSLPYLGVTTDDDPIYLKTRDFVLSEKNPFYFSGSRASGIGSPHTPDQHVWPIALAIQAMTSGNQEIQLQTLDLLERNDAGTGKMHESFHVNDDRIFTREWFSWSDMTYVDLVLASVNYQNS